MKKVLYYNWAEIDSNRGGGVTVYQRNLISELVNDKDFDITFLSSGREYKPNKNTPFIEKCNNSFDYKCKSYRIVNSPVLAPVQQAVKNFENYLNDKSLYYLLKDFIIEQGNFDVIHLNNIEGLSLSVLELKKDFPNSKFIYSMHNYFPFCPQVALWKHSNEICNNNNNCYDCSGCYSTGSYNKVRSVLETRYVSPTKKIDFIQNDNNSNSIINSYVNEDTYINKDKDHDAEIFRNYINKNIEYINKYIDIILAVSNRVKEIAIQRGIDSTKIHTNYIGTKVADNQIGHGNCDIFEANFKIVYLGYMSKEKGFYFFLESLKKIDLDLRKNITVTIAAKIHDKTVLQDIDILKKTYSDIIIFDGYNHTNLDEILKNKHLGVVPVLWEDNLPQVAIEMVSKGVPILASSFGGASELTESDKFRFKGGNNEDFINKIKYLLSNRDSLNEFWEKHLGLKTMKNHIEELKKYY